MPKFEVPKHLKVVIVRWRDAWSDVSTEGTQESILEEGAKDCLRLTAGYYLGKTDKFLVLASDYDEFADKPKFQNVTAIPIGMVLKVIPCNSSSCLPSNRSRSKSASSVSPSSSPSVYTLNSKLTPTELDSLPTKIYPKGGGNDSPKSQEEASRKFKLAAGIRGPYFSSESLRNAGQPTAQPAAEPEADPPVPDDKARQEAVSSELDRQPSCGHCGRQFATAQHIATCPGRLRW